MVLPGSQVQWSLAAVMLEQLRFTCSNVLTVLDQGLPRNAIHTMQLVADPCSFLSPTETCHLQHLRRVQATIPWSNCVIWFDLCSAWFATQHGLKLRAAIFLASEKFVSDVQCHGWLNGHCQMLTIRGSPSACKNVSCSGLFCAGDPKWVELLLDISDNNDLLTSCSQSMSLMSQSDACWVLQQTRSSCSHTNSNQFMAPWNDRAKQTAPSTDDPINDERVSPTHEVATCFTMCNDCLADVQLWGPMKRGSFDVRFQSVGLRNNSNDLLQMSHSLLFRMKSI